MLNERRIVDEDAEQKTIISKLFKVLGPRFADRPGGYTRILRLAQPRLGDAGAQAILEFVGQNDRVVQRSEKPAFDEPDSDTTTDETAAGNVEEPATEDTEETSEADASTDANAEAAAEDAEKDA